MSILFTIIDDSWYVMSVFQSRMLTDIHPAFFALLSSLHLGAFVATVLWISNWDHLFLWADDTLATSSAMGGLCIGGVLVLMSVQTPSITCFSAACSSSLNPPLYHLSLCAYFLVIWYVFFTLFILSDS